MSCRFDRKQVKFEMFRLTLADQTGSHVRAIYEMYISFVWNRSLYVPQTEQFQIEPSCKKIRDSKTTIISVPKKVVFLKNGCFVFKFLMCYATKTLSHNQHITLEGSHHNALPNHRFSASTVFWCSGYASICVWLDRLIYMNLSLIYPDVATSR